MDATGIMDLLLLGGFLAVPAAVVIAALSICA